MRRETSCSVATLLVRKIICPVRGGSPGESSIFTAYYRKHNCVTCVYVHNEIGKVQLR